MIARRSASCRRAGSQPARIGHAGALLAAGLLTAGCATTPPPQCPDAQLRRVACASGVRVLTYDESLDPARYCEAVTDLARRAGPSNRSDPPVRLSDGVRTMNSGLSGWILFPPPKDLTDSPGELRRFWQLRNCVPPPP